LFLFKPEIRFLSTFHFSTSVRRAWITSNHDFNRLKQFFGMALQESSRRLNTPTELEKSPASSLTTLVELSSGVEIVQPQSVNFRFLIDFIMSQQEGALP
jgi:hypothetical protein